MNIYSVVILPLCVDSVNIYRVGGCITVVCHSVYCIQSSYITVVCDSVNIQSGRVYYHITGGRLFQDSLVLCPELVPFHGDHATRGALRKENEKESSGMKRE